MRSVGEGGDLRSAGFKQIGEFVVSRDGEDVSAVPRTREQAAALIGELKERSPAQETAQGNSAR